MMTECLMASFSWYFFFFSYCHEDLRCSFFFKKKRLKFFKENITSMAAFYALGLAWGAYCDAFI